MFANYEFESQELAERYIDSLPRLQSHRRLSELDQLVGISYWHH
jgi:hypothetical protein